MSNIKELANKIKAVYNKSEEKLYIFAKDADINTDAPLKVFDDVESTFDYWNSLEVDGEVVDINIWQDSPFQDLPVDEEKTDTFVSLYSLSHNAQGICFTNSDDYARVSLTVLNKTI